MAAIMVVVIMAALDLKAGDGDTKGETMIAGRIGDVIMIAAEVDMIMIAGRMVAAIMTAGMMTTEVVAVEDGKNELSYRYRYPLIISAGIFSFYFSASTSSYSCASSITLYLRGRRL
jgi:hypothetical protein